MSQDATQDEDGGRPSWRQRSRWSWLVWAALAVAIAGMVGLGAFDPAEELTYTEFVELLEDGEVERITVDEDGRVDGELGDGTAFQTVVPPFAQDELEERLLEEEVEVEAVAPADGFLASVLAFLPFLLIIGLFLFLLQRGASQQMGMMQGMGKSQAQVIDAERPDVTFDDVAGYEEVREEVREIIDYLRDPERFREVGARGPGGILLLGASGTGKTLMARAIAGEADVAFISASGSEFVEMLVGVGASRVRDLFEKARERQPSIIFIDELDSIGRKRGSQTNIGSNNEQEQTLNQLLKELDGFDPREGIVILAATNRPEMLDEALLRPGRFDRQIEVPLPTQDDRVKILEVHLRGKPIADDVDLTVVARGTPGFSGAQLENLVNEAAITALRDDRTEIQQVDFDAARDRVVIGKRQSSDLLREAEKHRVAVHEAGHAIVAAVQDAADPVAKVTILPAPKALGTTEQLPTEERRLASEAELQASLVVRLGGRAAELVVLDEMSTGAAEDLAQATELAGRMVREFGLSDRVGPVGYPTQDEPGGLPGVQSRPYAEDTQQQVDEEVQRLLREAAERAEHLIEEHREAFDQLVDRLLEQEQVDGEEIQELLA
ncbi:MAG: ATP-dependent metallopeptidase FtsH/Yme1/Tma family protein [Nitriliruptor sp.]|nr:MAG: ATP-dependent metallopeptidase FtsH/Yme1/Tma family protein [Nitriliruptor sp.]